MTLLAAFQVLLSRYSGQDDIAIGTPIAGRNRAEIEGLIGFFVNTLVMRTDLSGDPTFRELLGRVREVCLGAYAHQELPFEKLVEELKPERDLSRTPLFQVFFNMLNVPGSRIELPGLRMETMGRSKHGENVSKFDVTLYAREREGEIALSAVYNVELFEADTMSRMLVHFQTLLEGIVADPGRHLSDLSLLTEEERRRLPGRSTGVTEGVRPADPFTEWTKEEIEQPIPQRFEQQVREYPHNIAVKTRHHEWTYAELNAKANQVAHTILRRCGGGPDGQERIALLFEHGAPMIAGLLGVLKAGNTYVPLDASYPRERLSYMVKDARAATIVTDEANLTLATALTEGELELINIDELGLIDEPDSSARAADVEDVLAEDIDLAISPEDVAYILYTSGSTGRPKGVVQNHRNVLHFIRAYTNNLQIGAEDRLTLLSSYSFDAAVMDVFGALLNGATLCPVDVKEEGLVTLEGRMIEWEITVYHSTPTVYRHFVGALSGAEERFPKVRLVVLGGEAVNREDVELYKTHFSEDCLLVNLLGSTESSVSLQRFVDRGTPLARHAVAAGHPVEGTEVLLLDEVGKEAEVFGEIVIRSPYIALGYWRKPELSREVFLPDPAGGDRRIYRTGDVGRLLPDGQIEWRGRKDQQIKLRGHRIELGEIETVLIGHPSVSEVAAVVREEEHGERRLVAYYVVTAQRQAPATSELRDYLKEKLPEYMVPAMFVVLEALPLTPNGKLDRRALPTPDPRSLQAKDAYVQSRTPVEEALVGIWEEVLGLERVGVHDDFFELGGHSLLATQVVSRLREALQLELPLRDLFMSPTVALLAQRVVMAHQSTASLSIAKTFLGNLDEGRL